MLKKLPTRNVLTRFLLSSGNNKPNHHHHLTSTIISIGQPHHFPSPPLIPTNPLSFFSFSSSSLPAAQDGNYEDARDLTRTNRGSTPPHLLKSGLFVDSGKDNPGTATGSRPGRPVVCARCHSLRHYGV